VYYHRYLGESRGRGDNRIQEELSKIKNELGKLTKHFDQQSIDKKVDTTDKRVDNSLDKKVDITEV
jgi:hypothetical protein